MIYLLLLIEIIIAVVLFLTRSRDRHEELLSDLQLRIDVLEDRIRALEKRPS
jgi:hypothetical protein